MNVEITTNNNIFKDNNESVFHKTSKCKALMINLKKRRNYC